MKWFFVRRWSQASRGRRGSLCAVCGHGVGAGEAALRAGDQIAHTACAMYRAPPRA